MAGRVYLFAVLVGLGGCAYESRQPPVSTSNGLGPVSQMPQPANSLPLGSAVAAPLDRGAVISVPTGPGRQ